MKVFHQILGSLAGRGVGAVEQVVGVVLGDQPLVGEGEGMGRWRAGSERLRADPGDVGGVEVRMGGAGRFRELVDQDETGVVAVEGVGETFHSRLAGEVAADIEGRSGRDRLCRIIGGECVAGEVIASGLGSYC